MFTYNEKGAADQMSNTLKQIVKHTGTIYGQDISNELHSRRVVVISKPQHTADVLRKHEAKVSLRDRWWSIWSHQEERFVCSSRRTYVHLQ